MARASLKNAKMGPKDVPESSTGSKKKVLTRQAPARQPAPKFAGWSYVGMGGGKGTVTPLLKGKVRIPPPAGHFIDPPLSQEIFLLTPLCHKNFSPILQAEIIKNVPQKCKIAHILNKFSKLPQKVHFRALFAIL